MNYPALGHFRSARLFKEHLESLADGFSCVEELRGSDGPLAQPLVRSNGRRTIGNRFATHPMEGWDGTVDGLPTELTRRRWRHFGLSGAKLIWGGEAVAVREDGRANPNQLFISPSVNSAHGLETLRDDLIQAHRDAGDSTDDLVIGLQLTHSGRYSRPFGEPVPLRAQEHPILDRRLGITPGTPPLSDGELEAIGECFVAAARIAQEIGFDFVDVKCCHSYLLYELLGARMRPGNYGGSFENRTRLLRRVIEGIQSACPSLEVGVRLSVVDSVPYAKNAETGIGEIGDDVVAPYTYGFGIDEKHPEQEDMNEPLQLIGMLRDLGVQLINASLGSPYYSPHMLRPATYPPTDGYLPPEDPLLSVIRHLRIVRECMKNYPDMIWVGSGYTYLQEYLAHVAEFEVGEGHVDIVGIGRMLLSYPDMPRDVLAGNEIQRKRICRTFSDCTSGPRNGMLSGCFPLDPHYKVMPEAKRLKEIKRSISS